MLTDTPAWQDLYTAQERLRDAHLRTMIDEPGRFDNYHMRLPGMMVDISRHIVDDAAMGALYTLARAQNIEEQRDRMFTGAAINESENRAVLHTALRRPATDTVRVDGENIMPFVHEVLARMEAFTNAVHDGTWRGHTGKPIRHVVNIGIGGSDLGPRMVCRALRAQHKPDLTVHFVSNVDGADIDAALRQCDPETTLFMVASKTFTTVETMTNAHTARAWLLAALTDEAAIARHFVALSTNEGAVTEFGIAADNMFPFRDWVGGRYSLWSAIGMPVALACGFDVFRSLLDGARAMDRHFCDARLEDNVPVTLALLGLWYRNFWDAQSAAVIPYSADMALMPNWLQQLDMESNGKAVSKDGRAVNYETGPVIFGTPGTDAQHAFFQLIHQGTALIPCDFIAPVAAPSPHGEHHKILLANMVAQAEALARGRSRAESDNDLQKTFPGNRPSTLILLDRLDAHHLGMLLALYEHKVFVQGMLWNINSFDQWGVELGKIMAKRILADEPNPQKPGILAYLEGDS